MTNLPSKAYLLFLLFVFWTKLYATPISLEQSFAGNINFVMAGGTLRTGADGVAPCNVTTGPVNGSVSGIPTGATIVKAFLYWAGSGSTADNNVTFNGNNITADQSFSETFVLAPDSYPFFGAFKDVTSFVSGNGTYSFENLTVNTGAPHCAVSAVLSGWGLIVIYSHSGEDFRVINLYDGLQFFRGSSITMSPSNFEIPASPINGKLGVISWEGDVGNSAALSGFSENVTFNGNALTDTANPANNQYNSTINIYGTSNNYYGVDIDSYDISSYLTQGDTSASSIYSSGGDLVLLTAKVISVTNVPVSDLEITKIHSGDFSVGQNGQYTITVENNGPVDSTGTITVSDALPTGLDYVSATGTGWSCGYSAPNVTCTRTGTLANGASAPPITLTVSVAHAAYPSVSNTATATGPNFDNQTSNNSSTDPTTVLSGNLSTSTKSVSDLNGGEPDVGDVLRYEIELINTSSVAATGVSVTDNIPALVNNFTVISIPGGSTNSSTGAGTGSNNTGYLNISNITVPASSSVFIYFDVTIDGAANPGNNINNTANINVQSGVGATPNAPQVTVSPSLLPSSGNKDLYFSIPSAGTTYIQRTQPSGASATNTHVINGAGANQSFVLNPVLAANLTIASGNASVIIRMACSNQCGGAQRQRTIQVHLEYWNGASWVSMGNQSQTFTLGAANVYSTQTFTINIGSNTTVLQGRQIRARILNNTANAARHIILMPLNGGIYSRAVINATTVINVDSTEEYTTTYPGGTIAQYYDPSTTAYLRAVVSDPFGSFDITSARITIVDVNGSTQVNNQLMTQVADSGAATKTYEYAYAVPGGAAPGSWTYTITAYEGTEGTITDSGVGAFRIGQFIPTVVKSSEVLSDPINNLTNPKRIPGSIIRYTITVANTGRGLHDIGSLKITDRLPTNMSLCVTTTCTGGIDPIQFVNGTPTSNLAINYSTDVSYSNQVGGGPPFNYIPNPNMQGYDAAITGIQVIPQGTMATSSGSPPHPNFTLRLIMKLN